MENSDAAPLDKATPAPDVAAALGAFERAAAGLRTTPPHAIVAVSFLVAVVAGVGVTAIEYWVHALTTRGRALVDLAAVPAQAIASVPAVRAPSVVERTVEPPAAPPAVAPPAIAPPAVARPPAPVRSRARVPTPAARKAAMQARSAQSRKTAKEARTVRRVALAPVERHASEAAAKPPTLDDQYESAVRKKCRSGALGLPCREVVRWRLCDGRWNDDGSPGAASCHVRREEGAFPPPVIAN